MSETMHDAVRTGVQQQLERQQFALHVGVREVALHERERAVGVLGVASKRHQSKRKKAVLSGPDPHV